MMSESIGDDTGRQHQGHGTGVPAADRRVDEAADEHQVPPVHPVLPQAHQGGRVVGV